MNYKDIVADFIKEYPDYKSDINNFTEYLEMHWKGSLSDDSFRILFQGIDTEFILKSLIYNVEEIGRYKSKTKAKRYSVVIGQFFKYIKKNTDIINTDLYNAISSVRLQENSYMRHMISYIEKCEFLTGIVEQETLTSKQAEELLMWSNEQLDNGDWEDATNFRKAMAAIGMKMMMLYGITYRELRKVKWNDYDELHSFIVINGFELRLPLKLSVQLKEMKDFVSEKNIINNEDFLFTDYCGEQWGEVTSYSGIPDYTSSLVEITSVTSLVKYGISQLLKTGLSSSCIKLLTGAKDRLIDGCVNPEDRDFIALVNSAVTNADIYYEY